MALACQKASGPGKKRGQAGFQGIVFVGEAELARAMTDRILSDWEAQSAAAALPESQSLIRAHSS